MREFADRAVALLKRHDVDYGDVRIVRRRAEQIEVKNGQVEKLSDEEDRGFGVRVIVSGCWGFAASAVVTEEELNKVVRRAVEIARASAKVAGPPVRLARAKPEIATWIGEAVRDPFEVSLDEKLQLLTRSDEVLHKDPAVSIAQSFINSYLTEKTFASTEGAFLDQHITECGGGIAATAIKDGNLQVRSYPNSFRGNFATSGYEFVEGMDLVGNAERVAAEAAELIGAPPCPAGRTTVIIDGPQLALQVHESIGHAIELDRIMGSEASYAGTSFLSPDKLRRLQYGSGLVNVEADATVPGGLGSFGFDDEGVKAVRTDIIREGLLVGFLTSRQTAAAIGQLSNGTMRADGWNRIPLIRMTNINLLPGSWELDDLISDTKEGLLLSVNRSWSIDDKRLNFQFGTELAREITNGKLGRIYRNPTYTGITPEFWNSCDAICSQRHWKMWGTPNCGKGEPSQTAHVGHGTAPSRFRNVQVGTA